MHTITRIAAGLFIGLLTLSGCTKDREPIPDVSDQEKPEGSYFAGFAFSPKTLDDDNLRVMVSFCDSAEPVDTEIGIYEFDPDTNVDEALASIASPGVDEDGEPNDTPIPDEYRIIMAKYADSQGMRLSDYNKKKQFAVDLDKNVVSIISHERADGTMAYFVIATTNSINVPTEVCLN